MSSSPGRVSIPSGGFRAIAVLRLSSLGDVILTLPVVRALRAAWPEAHLSYWIKEEFADVVRFDPAISHVRELESDARRIEDLVSMSAELEACDLIVDLHGNTRTRVLTLRQHAPVLRVQGDRLRRLRWVHARWSRPSSRPDARERFARVLSPLGLAATEAPRVEVGEEAERWAAQWFDQNHMAGAVVLAPVARHATKRWPQEYWIELLDRLGVAGIPVIVASLGRERRELPALDAAVAVTPRTHWLTEPLPRMAAVLGNGRAAVTCDSGWMHLAAARGMRVVALFGSTAPELGFAPAGEGHVVLCRHEPCQPCTLHGRDQCPLGHFRCMRELKPDEVWRALESLLTTPA